jgi:Rad3-related DNA helicase
MSDAINQVESITTNMTKNEFFKERLVEKEEELKAKKDLEKLDKMIQKEKEKENCIQTFLERESRRMARKAKEKQAEEELGEIKKEVMTQVKEIKTVFRSKMSRLKQETERSTMEKMKQLTDMKLRITSMLIDQEIKGSVSNCKQDKEENKIAYCNARYPVNWFENKHCRIKQAFCGVCCEKEFSVRFAEDREKCL